MALIDESMRSCAYVRFLLDAGVFARDSRISVVNIVPDGIYVCAVGHHHRRSLAV